MRAGQLSRHAVLITTTLLMLAVGRPAWPSTSGIRIIQSETTTVVMQYGITWTFKEPVRFGTYANGDYWVVGPVEIIDIYPPSEVFAGRVTNGSMVNPDPTLGPYQGFDSSSDVSYYRADLNVARPDENDLSAMNPLTLLPGSSLLSSISHPAPAHWPQVDDVAVLTVVESPPPEGSFRPPYVGSDKVSEFTVSDLNTGLLLNLTPVAGTPSMKSVAEMFQRCWIDFMPGWQQRDIQPTNNMPRYGREMAMEVGIASLMLNLDFSLEEKRDLLIRFVQYGIDLWGIVEAGGTDNWTPDGGVASGRKWPILFAGLLLGDTDMRNVGPGDGSGSAYFGEDAQTFYVDGDAVSITNGPTWNPDLRSPNPQPYDSGMLGMPEWGIRHATQPNLDDASWTAVYRNGSTANAWAGFVLCADLMGARALWNHEELFDYQHRYMVINNGDPDPFGYGPVNDQPTSYSAFRSADSFTENMWDAYWSGP